MSTAVSLALHADEHLTQLLSSVILTTRVAVIVADALVVWSTWYKMFATYRQAKVDGFTVPVTTLLIENGEHDAQAWSLPLDFPTTADSCR